MNFTDFDSKLLKKCMSNFRLNSVKNNDVKLS